MGSSSVMRRGICIKLSVCLNLAALLYLAVHYWEPPGNSNSVPVTEGPPGNHASMFFGRFLNLSPPDPVETPLVLDNGKRTLNSVRQLPSSGNVTTNSPSGTGPEPVAAVVRSPILCHEKDMSPRKAMRGQYWVLYNYIGASRKLACNATLTYTTHCDHTFLDNLGTLVSRWQGPVSVSIYTPGSDYKLALEASFYYRQCVNESTLIQDYVTFHFYFPYQHRPKGRILSQRDLANYKADCSKVPTNSPQTYRRAQSLTYPVNVGRNVARESANSHYIFPSDIELYPNPGLIPAFLDMVTRGDETALQRHNPKVFVSSIFEIKTGAELPENKEQLKDMLKKSVVIPFHKKVCSLCHAIPKAKEWSQATGSDDLHVFHIGKRNPPFQHWEPIYISTHDVPLYDERLSWEGRSDKMTQGYQLCVMDYDFLILDNAFLIHRPGIKTQKVNLSNTDKAKVSAQNDFIRRVIMPELKQLYGSRKGCEK